MRSPRRSSELTGEQWEHEVRTRQGRLIRAAQLPWLRAREVMVHAVDLDGGVGFADLPEDFCAALRANIIRRAENQRCRPSSASRPMSPPGWRAAPTRASPRRRESLHRHCRRGCERWKNPRWRGVRSRRCTGLLSILGTLISFYGLIWETIVNRNSIELAALVASLPDGTVITDPDRMANYRWDRANDPSAGVPLAVARVMSTADAQEIVRFAADHALPVVTRGAGTGLSGGSSAIDGCIVISTERMRNVIVDPITRTVTVQPGALNAEVKAAATEHGLWYPPDPSSFEICSIGGNLATNAGGLCCVKYGVTTDYVLGMTVVLADGSVVKLGGPRLKDAAGLSLLKLFVGSEGTLGVITEAILRLVPAQRPPATLVAWFAGLEHATDAVVDITRRLRPSMLEFMDRAAINAVEDVTSMGLDRTAEALLVIQSDEPGVTALDDAEQLRLRRRAAARRPRRGRRCRRRPTRRGRPSRRARP